jgi:hypothetical protein
LRLSFNYQLVTGLKWQFKTVVTDEDCQFRTFVWQIKAPRLAYITCNFTTNKIENIGYGTETTKAAS